MLAPFNNTKGWSRQIAREKYLPICNVDGGMSHQWFHKVLRSAGCTDHEIDIITNSIDSKEISSGRTGVVDLDDFLDFLGYEREIEVILCTDAMAEAMQWDESKAALKELFDELDKDSNGKVSCKEWGSKVGQKKDILSKYFGGSTPAEIGQAFKRIDKNGDGSLSWDEFVAAAETQNVIAEKTAIHIGEVMQTDEGKAALREFFESLDKDCDGKVSGREWFCQLGKTKHTMLNHFCDCTPADIGHAFKRIDTNGDGSLSWDEFVAAAEKKIARADITTFQMAEVMQTEDGKAALKEFFDLLDKNNDGKVSAKEWFNQLGKTKHSMLKYFCDSSPAEIGHAFKRIDANGDGELSWDEFVAAAHEYTLQ